MPRGSGAAVLGSVSFLSSFSPVNSEPVLNVFNSAQNEAFSKRINNLKVYYTNCDCLTLSKKRELEVIIQEEDPDIIALTETHPKRSLCEINELFYNIESYVRYSSDLTSGRGVTIYVKSKINSFDLRVQSNFAESVWCQISLNDNNNNMLTLGRIYRSPNSTVDKFNALIEMLKYISNKKYTHLLIFGDFNIKEIDWNSGTTAVGENHVASFFFRV